LPSDDSDKTTDSDEEPPLTSDEDSSVTYDFENRNRAEPDMVLIDSDDEIGSDKDDDDDENERENEGKNDDNDGNAISGNDDFIGFGFSSSDDEQLNDDDSQYSDDGVISGDDVDFHHSETASSSFPWVKDHDHSKQKEIADWLTMEMKDFVNYISPSSAEIETRNKVIGRLKKSIGMFWPATETHVFGSCATDLYLPGSDIDMVVVSHTGDYESRSRLYQLSSFLRNKKLAKDIEVIAKAKVPIIKFVDPEFNIHIDISFERTNGIAAAKKIRKWLSSTPGLRELVLIVKQFLRSRKLNNVHVGGLGGYATILLCYHFLALHPKVATECMDTLDNLGTLLIEFF
jgi:non-canonical poly(A) RNA polymerase PAPD5/7